MRVCQTIRSLVLVGLLIASVSYANTFSVDGKDPLVQISKLGPGKDFRPIGKIVALNPLLVKMPSGKLEKRLDVAATGFLLSPCYVVTNYHAVFGKSKSPNAKDFSVSFTANRTVIAKPIVWGGKNKSKMFREDWALLKLEDKDCLGLEIGWLEPLETSFFELKDQSMITAGYATDRAVTDPSESIWVHSGCNRFQSPQGSEFPMTIFNNCALNAGQSGSPLMVRNDFGQLRYVGMQAADLGDRYGILLNYESRYGNVGLDLRGILDDRANDIVEADIKRKKRN